VESLERFTQNQRIIEEFVAQWFSPPPCTMARLAHVASLRDIYTGLCEHVILEQSYSKGACTNRFCIATKSYLRKYWSAAFQSRNATCTGASRIEAFPPRKSRDGGWKWSSSAASCPTERPAISSLHFKLARGPRLDCLATRSGTHRGIEIYNCSRAATETLT
jgi:hypothetical protein